MSNCNTCLHADVCAWIDMPGASEKCEGYLGEYKHEVRKHGCWVPQRIALRRDNHFVCSECQTLGSPLWKSCPVCDTKMDLPNVTDQTKKALEMLGQRRSDDGSKS